MSKISILLFTGLLVTACRINGKFGAFYDCAQAKASADQKNQTPVVGLTSEPSIGKSTLLASIKDGRYIIYFRHTTTERNMQTKLIL